MQPDHLWDVYEEHLDEASFLSAQWERALVSSNYTIDEVAAGPEARLCAHLDGLVLGGLPVAERLMVPALEDADPDRVWVAGWVLLQSEAEDRFETVWTALLRATEPERRRALGRALELSSRADLSARLSPHFGRHAPGVDAVIIDVAAGRDLEWLARLPVRELGSTATGELLGAVLRATRRLPAVAQGGLVERGLMSDDPSARAAAIELGTLLRVPSTRAICRQAIAERTALQRLAMLSLTVFGDASDYERLLNWATNPELARDALWALGFSGRVECAEHLLGLVEDAKLAPVAADSFGTITGLRIEGSFSTVAAPEIPDEVLDDDAPIPELRADDDLPHPHADNVRRWWQENARRFEPGARHVYGLPYSGVSVRSAFTRAPTWRRQGLQIALGATAAAPFNLRTWARSQVSDQIPDSSAPS
jgi:uncharacterized protein (TIGR02270 family)